MKLIRKLFNIAFMIAVIIVAYFLWGFLQKQEIVVTDTTKAVITQLRSVSKLETAEMTITKIMEAEKDLVDIIPSMSFDDTIQKALFGDKMIFELEGHVVAGIDLEKIKTGDIRTNIDGTVSINLPEAEILHIVIDENSKPYDRMIGILAKGKVDMETKIRNKAKEDMEKEAIDAGILISANKKALESIQSLLSGAGVKLR